MEKSIQAPQIIYLGLQNKASCIIANLPEAPLTCIDLWCKGGSSFEKKGEEGIAHFLEHMIFKGSSKLKEGEFDQKIEALGGSSNAATGLDDVHYYVLVPPKAVTTGIELLLNLVLSPKLPKHQFQLEREVVLEEIAQHKDLPEEQVFQSLLRNCWPNHSYGRPILGIEKSLKSITPEDMRSFHNRQYQPSNLSLSIAGFIPGNLEVLLNKSDLTKQRSTANQKEFNLKTLLPPSFKTGREEIKVPRLESARLTMAWPLSAANNQFMIVGADIATSILAEGRRSRLVQHLRENLQIVESVDMEITVLEKASLFLLEITCLEKDLERVEKEIIFLLTNCLRNEPTDKEMKRAKELVKNALCFGLELPSQIAGISASQALWDRHQALLEPLKYLENWNSSNIQKVFFAHLQQKNSFTLIARPGRDKSE
ncbi:M16 family metallopeptidase [Prochlorococcus marinus]|uniref:Zn-dependent peptidase n=1 Tax=Prochlorococcus marinus (strain SARG / CCMP1375 / SS120) TaxID=167539 RepID=Q7VCC3_PROMA|nr:Zn-dependent peptidase [Prochlorococcus marinus subsp. marinus str. CCMP1375]